MSELTINNISELQTFVNALKITNKQVIALSGPMGVGKTEFTKCLLKRFKGEPATSPTFSLHNVYENGERLIDHFDLYRLKNDEDLESSGFWDCFDQDSGLIVVEWANRLDKEVYPSGWDYIFIDLQMTADNHARRLKLSQIAK